MNFIWQKDIAIPIWHIFQTNFLLLTCAPMCKYIVIYIITEQGQCDHHFSVCAMVKKFFGGIINKIPLLSPVPDPIQKSAIHMLRWPDIGFILSKNFLRSSCTKRDAQIMHVTCNYTLKWGNIVLCAMISVICLIHIFPWTCTP